MRIRLLFHLFVRLFLRLTFRLFPPVIGADFSRPTRARVPSGDSRSEPLRCLRTLGIPTRYHCGQIAIAKKFPLFFTPKKIIKSMHYRK